MEGDRDPATPSGADNFDSSLAVDFELNPQETKVIRIVLAWRSPVWRGDKSNVYTRMYPRHYQDAVDVAETIAENHKALSNRIVAWQHAVYTDSNLPVWLRESLVTSYT